MLIGLLVQFCMPMGVRLVSPTFATALAWETKNIWDCGVDPWGSPWRLERRPFNAAEPPAGLFYAYGLGECWIPVSSGPNRVAEAGRGDDLSVSNFDPASVRLGCAALSLGGPTCGVSLWLLIWATMSVRWRFSRIGAAGLAACASLGSGLAAYCSKDIVCLPIPDQVISGPFWAASTTSLLVCLLHALVAVEMRGADLEATRWTREQEEEEN